MSEPQLEPGGTEKVTLPSGGWIEVRDPKSYRSRDKKAIMRGMSGTPEQMGDVAFGVELTDKIVVAMITAWSLPYGAGWPIPSLSERDPETGAPVVLDDLEIPDYDAILESANEVRKVVFPREITPDDHDKPASPTQPAAE